MLLPPLEKKENTYSFAAASHVCIQPSPPKKRSLLLYGSTSFSLSSLLLSSVSFVWTEEGGKEGEGGTFSALTCLVLARLSSSGTVELRHEVNLVGQLRRQLQILNHKSGVHLGQSCCTTESARQIEVLLYLKEAFLLLPWGGGVRNEFDFAWARQNLLPFSSSS